jgi:hypothetical protein
MSEAGQDIVLRSARNRMIDLLTAEDVPVIGDTYPLTDLNVVADQLTVAFGGIAKIPVENAQSGVVYRLCDPQGRPLAGSVEAEGHDDTLTIASPKVTEDVSYRISARKKNLLPALPPQDATLLDESAPVKVGIDTSLSIEILDAPLLQADKPTPQASDPRLVPYGASVTVQVANSQEGVDYTLIIDGRDLKGPTARGDLHEVTLNTGAMTEDATIEVRATKNLVASADKEPKSKALDAKLYLKVRANPALPVSVDPLIVDYRARAQLTLAGAQRSVTYTAYARGIADADFVRGPADASVLPAADIAGLQVRKPGHGELWQTADGYAALGAGMQGTGGALVLNLDGLREDTVVLVQASKGHRIDASRPDSPTVGSSVGVNDAAVVLVRPDPARGLKVVLIPPGATGGAALQVSDGQPGVFYYFTPAGGAELAVPAYFHKRDTHDPTRNKGVDQLALGIDFVIVAEVAQGAADPAFAAPAAPLIDVGSVAVGADLSARAVKAQTGLEAKMTNDAVVEARPAPGT